MPFVIHILCLSNKSKCPDPKIFKLKHWKKSIQQPQKPAVYNSFGIYTFLLTCLFLENIQINTLLCQ